MKTLHIRKILVPTDLSPTAQLALKHACFMAALFKAELVLLHVIEITETTYSIYNPAVQIRDLDGIREVVSEKLQDLAKSLRKEYGMEVSTIVTNGNATASIISTAKEEGADIIMMGTQGANGAGEHFIGSHAQRTVSGAPCPVITVHKNSGQPGFRNIILPVDTSLHSLQKVNAVIRIAKMYNALVHLVGLPDAEDPNGENKVLQKMKAVEEVLNKAEVLHRSAVLHGKSLATEALRHADAVKGDLIVVLTDHESELNTVFTGNFAKQIVNHSDIPVMSIHPEEGEFESTSLSAASPF